MLFVSCGSKEPVDPTPPTPPIETKDTKAPVISVVLSSVNVIGGQKVTLGTSELKIGDKAVATWSDDVSKTCKAGLELDGKAISSGTKLSDPGKLKLSVTDEAGNTASADITLTNEDSQAPQISVVISEKNVIAGVKVSIQDNQLLFDDAVAATWADDYSTAFTVEMSITLDGASAKTVNPGDVLLEAGKLTLTVADEFQNKATGEITLTAIAVTGLENLQNLSLQVNQTVNLLEGITITEGLTLAKVEIEENGARNEVANPKTFTPDYPGTVNIILTISKPEGNTIEVKVENLMVKALDYTAPKMQTANIIQERYFWYNNLQQSTRDFIYPHLLASYTASNYSKQDNWIHIIMGEDVDAPDVEHIGRYYDPSSHAYSGYFRFRAINPDTPIKDCRDLWPHMLEYLDQHPDKFFTIGEAFMGIGGSSQEELRSCIEYPFQQKALEKQNVILLIAGGNHATPNWKIYNEEEKEGNRYEA